MPAQLSDAFADRDQAAARGRRDRQRAVPQRAAEQLVDVGGVGPDELRVRADLLGVTLRRLLAAYA